MEALGVDLSFLDTVENSFYNYNQELNSDIYQVSVLNNNQSKVLTNDTALFTHNFLPIKVEESGASIYNLEEFPVDLQDIEILNLEFEEAVVPTRDTECNISLPEIVVQSCEDNHHSDESGFHSVSHSSGDDDDMEEETEPVHAKLLSVPSRLKRRHESMSSDTSYTTSDDDGEWRPSLEKSRRRSKTQRISESSDDELPQRNYKTKRPTPQKRSPGTSCKMVQWIVSLLRDPKYNPSVITWLDEAEGVFTIKNTVKYAKLWGEKKNNKNMNYEKLSRGMRYYYRNGELEAIDQRLTYKFGPSATDFRALNSDDPNFEIKL